MNLPGPIAQLLSQTTSPQGDGANSPASSAANAGPNLRKPLTARNRPSYPPNHKPAMQVPKGGSMCANCKFLDNDGQSCTETNFIKWNGSPTLPAPADEYCSDWYEPKDNPKSRAITPESAAPPEVTKAPFRSPGSLS